MRRAFSYRDFRRFWIGSLIANVGVWMQSIALGWLVFSLTSSASWLGTVSFCGQLPVFALGLVGGAIADRASRRTILLGTQAMLAGCAAALAALTATGTISLTSILVVAVVSGAANALATPSMMSVIPSLVRSEDLFEAISLNSVQFNLARALGPAVAGLLYERIGAAGCFAINAGGFLLQVGMLLSIRLPDQPAAAPMPMLRALREVAGYVRTHGVIGPGILLAAVLSVFGFPYLILMPALAKGDLGLGPSGLGGLMAATGIGAVLGSLALSRLGRRWPPGRIARISTFGFGAILAAFAALPWLDASVRPPAATALLAATGFLQSTTLASLTTSIQTAVEDEMRGRVMSILTVIYFGFSTAGGLALGALGDRIGVARAIGIGGTIIVVAALGAAAALSRPTVPPRPGADPRGTRVPPAR